MNIKDLVLTLAAEAADAAAMAHGMPVPGAASVATEALLRDLLQVQDEQAERLKRVEADVQRIVAGPWRTARLHLHEALLPDRSREQMISSLDRAAASLREALSLEPGRTLSRAYVAFDLAVVMAALGDRPVSAMYAREALATATDLVRDKAQEFSRRWRRYSPGAGVKAYAQRLGGSSTADSLPLAALALDWYRLALAVERLSGERAFVVAERGRLGPWHVHHYWAVELTAAGDQTSLRIAQSLQRRGKRYPSDSSPDIDLPSWSQEDVPRLPSWWPRPWSDHLNRIEGAPDF